MKLQSIKYERRGSFASAADEAQQGYSNELLLSDAPKAPFDVSHSTIVGVPSFFGHLIAAISVASYRIERRPIRVLDIGGALGGHYGFVRTTFGEAIDLEWTILENSLYADYCRKMITTPALNFSDKIETVAGEEFDFVYLSSSLPYIADVQAVLDMQALRQAQFVYISRTGLDAEEIPFLQTVEYDVGTIQYAGRIISRPWLFATMERSHELLTSWDFEQYSVDNRSYMAPSMLWVRQSKEAD